MTTYEIISVIIGGLGLVVGSFAHFRISKIVNKDSNKVGKQYQSINNGNGNKIAGRDIE